MLSFFFVCGVLLAACPMIRLNAFSECSYFLKPLLGSFWCDCLALPEEEKPRLSGALERGLRDSRFLCLGRRNHIQERAPAY